jgi:hypothetical protein
MEERKLESLEDVELDIDVLVKDVAELITTLLNQYARENGREALKVVRVS